MSLSISNIAWPAEDDEKIYEILETRGIHLEVAPTRFWPQWEGASLENASEKKNTTPREIRSLQALLYQKSDLHLFKEGEKGREDLLNHLKFVIDLASCISSPDHAPALVFGSPKSRQLSGLSYEKASEIAVHFFKRVGVYALSKNVVLCLEPNPTVYNADFMTNAADAADIVRRVDHPGLRLTLDTGCAFLADDDIFEAIRSNADILYHIQIAEPQLGSFENPKANHIAAAKALYCIGYKNIVSIEMRPNGTEAITTALDYVSNIYSKVLRTSKKNSHHWRWLVWQSSRMCFVETVKP